MPPELFTEGITEEDSGKIIFPPKIRLWAPGVGGGSQENTTFKIIILKLSCCCFFLLLFDYLLRLSQRETLTHLILLWESEQDE